MQCAENLRRLPVPVPEDTDLAMSDAFCPPHLFLIVWRSKRYLEISLSGYDCIERFSFRVCLPLGTKTGYNVKV